MPSIHPQLANEPHVLSEFLGAHNAVSLKIEDRINLGIDKLVEINRQNRTLHKLMAALNLASQNDNGADFTDNTAVREAIDAISELECATDILGYPDFAKGEQYRWGSSLEITATLENIGRQVDLNARDVYQVEMFMKLDTESRIQITECAQKTLDMMIRHLEKIISKYRTN